MNDRPYVIEEAGISIAAVALNKTYSISRTGYLRSLWVRLTNIELINDVNVTVYIRNHLGNLKPVKNVDIPAGERDFVFFYDNNKGYPLIEHNTSANGVVKDEIVVKTVNNHPGNSVDIEIICI